MGAIPTPESLKGKRVLMVLAHPDDEVIFGWPILRMEDVQKGVLILSWNKTQQASEGPLREVCKRNGAELVGLPLCQNNFYRLEPRYVEHTLMDAVQVITTGVQSAVSGYLPDFVFTHNPMGEYGHGDHRLLFQLCANYPLLLTDICLRNKSHPSTEQIPRVYRDTFYRSNRRLGSFSLDLEWYEGMKQIYEQGKAWTWGGHTPVTKCGLYMI